MNEIGGLPRCGGLLPVLKQLPARALAAMTFYPGKRGCAHETHELHEQGRTWGKNLAHPVSRNDAVENRQPMRNVANDRE